MSNLASLMGKPVRKFPRTKNILWPIPQQMIGIEVEAEANEGCRLPDDGLVYWEAENDGSLLHGREYILARPLRGKDLSKAIVELFSPPVVLKRSTTGSTHIHLDMTEEKTTAETVKSLVLMAYCLEPVLFAIGDPAREWCGYTNKLISAPDVLLGAIMSSTEDNNFDYLKLLCIDNYNVGRYYGLNLMSLATYGSVEFRYFPTPESADELISWIKLVQMFKIAALENKVTDIIDIFNDEESYYHFINKYFTDWLPYFLEHAPSYQVLVTVRKALASANSCHFKESNEFNPDAVINNPALHKFVKKVEKEEEVEPFPVVVVERGHSAPNADNFDTCTILVAGSELYSNITGRWSYAHDHSTAKNKTYWKRLIKTINNFVATDQHTNVDLEYYKGKALEEIHAKPIVLRQNRQNRAEFVIGEKTETGPITRILRHRIIPTWDAQPPRPAAREDDDE